MHILDGMGRMFKCGLTLMLIVLLVYPPQVMLGRASEASSVEFTQKQFMQVSTACKSIVLNE